MWGDVGRYGETWGDMGRYGEVAARLAQLELTAQPPQPEPELPSLLESTRPAEDHLPRIAGACARARACPWRVHRTCVACAWPICHTIAAPAAA